MISQVVAALCLGWYIFILCVCAIGIFKIKQANLSRRQASSCNFIEDETAEQRSPHVTVIRPVKGLEPNLYECLASTFQQSYPKKRLAVDFCISDRKDPAFSTLQRLLADYPDFEARILIEEEDPRLSTNHGGHPESLGPNPKIRNMSRAYREAKGDIVWIVDCNVWVGPRAAKQMIDLLCGLGSLQKHQTKYSFVHQLPLSVDLSPSDESVTIRERVLRSGGLLEEMFLSSSHAKFYSAINAVAVAPCIVGKSNMFRKSHLDALTSGSDASENGRLSMRGIDHFSCNICEDHLIGDLLWKSPVPTPVRDKASLEGQDPDLPVHSSAFEWQKHAMLPPLCPENLAIQPMVDYSLHTYIDRRVRWLRVRKFTVTLATLVEPGTEAFLCSIYGAFGLTTLAWAHDTLHVPQTWTAFAALWFISIACWACIDRWLWRELHLGESGASPPFSRSRSQIQPLSRWGLAWLGRESLALPIWTWAFYFGQTVVWRGTKFSVDSNQRVRMVDADSAFWQSRQATRPLSSSKSSSSDTGSGGESGGKRRRD